MNILAKIGKYGVLAWTWLMGNQAAKEIVIHLLHKLAKRTDNTLDDRLVEAVAAELGVKVENES